MSQHPVCLPAKLSHPTEQLSCICLGISPNTGMVQFEVCHWELTEAKPLPAIYATYRINRAFTFATEIYNNEATRYGTEGQPNE